MSSPAPPKNTKPTEPVVVKPEAATSKPQAAAAEKAPLSASDTNSLVSTLAMVFSGIGFFIFIVILLFQGIPTSRTETYTSKTNIVYDYVFPVLILVTIFCIASSAWVYTSKTQYKLLPLLITPFISFAVSMLALYFSMFQITISTK
jgi:hypothetical protein